MKRRLPLLATLLAIIGIIMSPASVFAASTSNTVVSGQVPATISMTATSSLTMPSLVPGTTVTSSNITVNVNTNTSGWSLTAAESSSGDGMMATTGGTPMTNPLQIKGGELSPYSPLSSTVTLKNATGGSGNIEIGNISFQQIVAASQAAGDYSIIVVFTVSGGA